MASAALQMGKQRQVPVQGRALVLVLAACLYPCQQAAPNQLTLNLLGVVPGHQDPKDTRAISQGIVQGRNNQSPATESENSAY